MANVSLNATATLDISESHDTADGAMPLAKFIASRFIPNHVVLKSPAGRRHYHAILKHVMSPDLVDRLFAPYHGEVNGRLKALPGWPYLDHVRIGDITSDYVRRLTDSATEYGYSYQTVKHIRNVVNAVFNHARREKLFTGDNPVCTVGLPPKPEKHRPRLCTLHSNAILNMMESPEREIALITIATGLRLPEICALQWKHVNLGRSRTRVDGVWIPPGFMLVMRQWVDTDIVDVEPGKSKGVAVSAFLARAISKLNQDQGITDPNSFLIGNLDGSPVAPSQVRTHRLKPIARKLGLPWVSWKVLRTTYETSTQEFRLQSANDQVVRLRVSGLSRTSITL